MKLVHGEQFKYGYDNGKYGAEATGMLLCDTLVLRLPGSNHWRDWVDNFMPFRMKTLFENLKVHRAWYYYTLRLHRFLSREIFPESEIRTIHILGHSMGGAVGAILQQFLIKENQYAIKDVHCYTYGAPRPFSRRVCTVTAFVNRGDIVPSMPFWRPACGLIVKSKKFYFPFWKAHIEYTMDVVAAQPL